MSLLMGADADWQEGLRAYWYPRLHPLLTALPVRGYAVGLVTWNQYVCHCEEAEEVIEEELEACGFRRNPVAAYKRLRDGRTSEGSWVLLHKDAPDLVAPGMQLHITLFAPSDGSDGRVLFAHYEDDWRHDWRGHLRGHNFHADEGVRMAREYLDRETFLVLKTRSATS